MLRQLEVDGYSLAYEETGSGEPLLLIHGSLADYRGWRQQLPAFAAAHRTIAVSLRHCHPERWDGRGDDFTVERHARDLAQFVQALHIDPVDVVGHSRGGAVAIALALAEPRLVRRLVLADPGGLEALLPDTPEGHRMAGESATMFDRLRDDLARGDALRAAQAFVDSLGGPGAWERRTADQKRMLLDNITTGPACAERPSFTPGQLAALHGPILLVTGERSPHRYALMLEEMKRRNASVHDLVTIPGAAHAMNRENAGAFNAAVLAFLAHGVR